MKLAVLGGAGLLGRCVVRQLTTDGHAVDSIARSTCDLSLFSSVKKLLTQRYDWVINCAGIVKCRESESPRDTVLVNAAMPHWVEYEARRYRTRVLHVSTDCVFSGRDGRYDESSTPDPVDLYGASKLAGELNGSESITLRCSFIGLEPENGRGLLAWLLREAREQHKVAGYTNALWSGLSTAEMARVVSRVVTRPCGSTGSIYHVSGGTISKCDLLMLLRSALGLNLEIEPTPAPLIDRTLVGTRFRVATGYSPPTWNFMAQELAEEYRACR